MTMAESKACVPTASPRRTRRSAIAVALAGLAVAAAACGSSSATSGQSKAATTADTSTSVNITLTPQGCAPKPASVPAGSVEFDVQNTSADAVSEAELRTKDQAHILGEVENLTPGLSGSFSVTLQPGVYSVKCPGAATAVYPFKVTGKTTAAGWQTHPTLVSAVSGYSQYVNQNVASLVSTTQSFCMSVNAGNMTQAQLLYPQARVFYERIEPVAEIWGDLDVQIDGRWENPVTDASQFVGFHKLEQMMWADNTLVGAQPICDGLVTHVQQLQSLVNAATYSPLEIASGATDLVNEAATSKITGEEERYSNTDFIDFQANVDGAMEVFTLLKPYLQQVDPALVSEVEQRNAALTTVLATFKATPGYDGTGYVEYSQVLDAPRKQLSGAVNALAESLSKTSAKVS
jgi:iron uptake system component EfeO